MWMDGEWDVRIGRGECEEGHVIVVIIMRLV